MKTEGTFMKPQEYNFFRFIILLLHIIPLQVIAITAFTLISALVPAYQTIALADFIDAAMVIFQTGKDKSEIILPLIRILLCIVYERLIPSVRNAVDLSAQNRLAITLGVQMTDKRARLEYRYIEDKDTCDLIDRVCEKPEERFWSSFLNAQNGMKMTVKIVSLLAIIMAYAPVGGLIILAVCVPMLYLAGKMGSKNYELDKDAARLKRKYHYLAEVLTDREYAEERSLFGYGGFVRGQYNAAFDAACKKETKIEKKRYINMKSGSMVTIGIAVIVMGILLPAVQKGNMTSGIYISLVNAVFGLVQSMSWDLSGVMYGLVNLKEYLKDFSVFFMLEEKEGACDAPANIFGFEFSSLEFKSVSFCYPGTKRYILKDCSFFLSKEKRYAFVGVNGAGKSTIIKLLTGLYDDYEGEILINQKSIKTYSYAELKAFVSVVFQDFARYAVSVRDNVVLADRAKKNEDRLHNVLEKVGLGQAVASLKSGADTQLGRLEEESVDLSGGQWQRLAIARLLYADHPINILDEPTSALDPMAEAEIYNLFGIVNTGRFTIFITHRLGAARMADEILVLDGGKIAEQGSHEELMEKAGGIYRKMYESQKSWYA